MEWLRKENIRTKSGNEFYKGQLYHMLSNKVYIGKIVHKYNVYDGENNGIIDEITFERVQKLLYENKVDKICGTKCSSNSLLAGLIFDDNNNRMTPSHSTSHKRRYRYYVSQAIKKYNKLIAGSVSKIPAGEIEKFVILTTKELLQNKKQMQQILSEFDVNTQINLIKTAKDIENYAKPKFIQSIISRVVVSEKTVEITYDAKNIREILSILNTGDKFNLIHKSKEIESIIVTKQIRISQPSKSGNILILKAKENDGPEPNPYLVNALVKSYYYHKQIQNGKTIEDLQNEENLKDSKYIRNILYLKYISPTLTEQILNGTQPADLSLQKVLAFNIYRMFT